MAASLRPETRMRRTMCERCEPRAMRMAISCTREATENAMMLVDSENGQQHCGQCEARDDDGVEPARGFALGDELLHGLYRGERQLRIDGTNSCAHSVLHLLGWSRRRCSRHCRSNRSAKPWNRHPFKLRDRLVELLGCVQRRAR